MNHWLRTFLIISIVIICMVLSVSGQDKHCGIGEILHGLETEHAHTFDQMRSAFARFQRAAIAKSQSFQRNGGQSGPDSIVIIPVAFHIFHENGAAIGQGHNFTLLQIQEVVDGLNADFAGYNTDKEVIAEDFQMVDAGHTGIQFCIGKINRIPISSCSSWNADARFDDLNVCLPGGSGPGSNNDPNDYLNFYVTSLQDLLGIASCIPPVFNSCNTSTDGIILDWNAFTVDNNLNTRTAAHEIGHWLGLPHVNGDINGAGCAGDDGFEDTNIQAEQQRYQCNDKIPVSCGSRDNVHNYMDYSADCSVTSFTQMQGAQMRAILNSTRQQLSTSCNRGNCNEVLYALSPPIINNQNDSTFIFSCSGTINFLDILNQWYPALYNSNFSQGGLNYFKWTDVSGYIPGNYYDLANEEFFRSPNSSNDTTIYTLLFFRWNKLTSAFEDPDTAGRVEVILNGNNCTPCIPELSISGGVLQDNGCDNGINDLLEWCFQWSCEEEFSSVQFRIFEDNTVYFDTTLAALNEYLYQGMGVDSSSVWGASVRVDNGVWSDTITFDVEEINTDCPPLINDDCINALPLAVNTSYCYGERYQLISVTDDTAGVDVGCAMGSKDVWFFAEVPASGNITIQTCHSLIPLNIIDLGMQVYVGDNCSDLSLLQCSDDVEGAHPKIELTGRTPGERLYIQIVSYNDEQFGFFELCAYEPQVENCLDVESFSTYSIGTQMAQNNPTKWSVIFDASDDATVTSDFENCNTTDRSVLISQSTEALHRPDIPSDFEVLVYSVDVYPTDTSDMYIRVMHESTPEEIPALAINLYEGAVFVISEFGFFWSGFYDENKPARVQIVINRVNNALEIFVNHKWIDTYPFSTSFTGIPNTNFAGINFSGFYDSYYADCICYDSYDLCIDTTSLAMDGSSINSGTYVNKHIETAARILPDTQVTFYAETVSLFPSFQTDLSAAFRIVLFPIECGKLQDVSRKSLAEKITMSRVSRALPNSNGPLERHLLRRNKIYNYNKNRSRTK